jgi:hypothetical protein
VYGFLCTNPYINCTVKYGTELRHRRFTETTLKDYKKIRVNDQLYEAIKEKAAQNSQTIDQYAEYLLEKALTKGDNASANRSH